MYFEDIKLGMEIELAPAVVDRQKMIDFAVNYDNIPLHTDEEYASKTHFKRIIAPGVMSFMVVWAKFLEVDVFRDELLAGKSTKIEWFKPVYAEDVLTGKAVVSKLTERNARNGIVEVSISVHNQNGECVLTNVTEAIVKKRQ